jgi:hypothetical protein
LNTKKKKKRLRSGLGFGTAYYIVPPLAIGSGGAILQISNLFIVLLFEKFLYFLHPFLHLYFLVTSTLNFLMSACLKMNKIAPQV